jgi:hypothetical protein
MWLADKRAVHSLRGSLLLKGRFTLKGAACFSRHCLLFKGLLAAKEFFRKIFL